MIVYRNRLDSKKRGVFIELDTTRFLTIKTILQKKTKTLSKFLVFYKVNFKYIFWLFFSIFVIWIYYFIEKNNLFLKTNILETPKDFNLTKTAFESFLTWNATWAMFSWLNDFSVQNILMLVLIIIILQSVRWNLKTLFIDTVIARIFSFITFIFKMVCRAIFYIYNYIIYKLETAFIFATLYGIIKNKMIFNNLFLFIFTIIYFWIYFWIVYLYIVVGNHIYPNYILSDFGILISIFLSILLIYINIRNDIKNFKEFLVETEKVLLFLKEGKME